MEYNRLMAYIYAYNYGSKNRNTGFAKIEVKQDILRLHINMKCAYADGSPHFSVHLFYREGSRIKGIELGEMCIRQGIGEYKYIDSATNIEKSNIGFNSIRGLYICRDEDYSIVFASEWDDLGFNPDMIEKGTVADDMEKEEVVGYKVSEITEDENEEIVEKEMEPPLNSFERLMKDRNKVFIFSDDELYDCVEITPDDIEQLPNTNWALRNNTFLNHGFYHYRHLIIGKTSLRKGCGYFIGVPGVYTRRERSTASMFGFNYFKFSMRSDVGVSQFGYWYKLLDN